MRTNDPRQPNFGLIHGYKTSVPLVIHLWFRTQVDNRIQIGMVATTLTKQQLVQDTPDRINH